MSQLNHDAAYIHVRDRAGKERERSTVFDEEVYRVLATAHTVTSVSKTLLHSAPALNASEDRVAQAMQRLLSAERIELSPDS